MPGVRTLVGMVAAVGGLLAVAGGGEPAHADATPSTPPCAARLTPPPGLPPGRRCYRRPFTLELEVGPVWQSRNEVAVPGSTGTRFDLDDVTGAGPFAWGRATFDWQISRRHAVRALVAPLEVEGTGTLGGPVSFQGRTFAAGVPTRATYRFNSYRLTYRYTLWCDWRWTWRVGVTAKIRDAKIALSQGALQAEDTDVGFVPLLHLAMQYRISPRWRITADLDGSAAEQGRAFDFSCRLLYDVNPCTFVGLGYRTLEGGADVEETYAFAWLHQAFVSIGFRF